MSGKTRAEIIAEARRIREEILQTFRDVDHWNEHVRTPFEQPIDPDPDGRLRRMLRGLERMLAKEDALKIVRPVIKEMKS